MIRKTIAIASRYAFLAGSVVLFSAVTACKKPETDFKLERAEYAAPEQLDVTNNSINADSQLWELLTPDSIIIATSYQRTPSLFIPIMGVDGMYSLRLTCSNGRRSIRQEKPFFVKTKRGNLKITGYNGNETYTAFADNQYIGKASATGILQVKLPVGERNITLKSASVTYTETVTITAGSLATVYF